MRVEYVLTAEDYYEFSMAHLKLHKAMAKPPRSKRNWIVWRVTSTLLIAAVVFMMFRDVSPGAPLVREAVRVLLPMIFLVVILIVLGVWLRRGKMMYQRAFEESWKMEEQHVAEVTEDGVTIGGAGYVVRMEWRYFLRFAETAGTFVLFTDTRMGHIVPKRAFGSEDERQAFRGMCQARVGKGTAGFPVEAGVKSEG